MYIITKSVKSDRPFIIKEENFSEEKHIEINRREAYPEALELVKRYLRMYYCESGLEDKITAFDEEFKSLSLEKEINKQIMKDLKKRNQDVRSKIKVMNKLFWHLDQQGDEVK